MSGQVFWKLSSPIHSSGAPQSDPGCTSPNPNYFSLGVTVTALPMHLNPASQLPGLLQPGLPTQGNWALIYDIPFHRSWSLLGRDCWSCHIFKFALHCKLMSGRTIIWPWNPFHLWPPSFSLLSGHEGHQGAPLCREGGWVSIASYCLCVKCRHTHAHTPQASCLCSVEALQELWA